MAKQDIGTGLSYLRQEVGKELEKFVTKAEDLERLRAQQANDELEQAYWEFDARHKGYGQWKSAPQTERDAFKAVVRNLLKAAK